MKCHFLTVMIGGFFSKVRALTKKNIILLSKFKNTQAKIMSNKKYPVALFLWQRPENTKIILEKIASYMPDKLLIVVDGPRNDTDKVNIQAVLDEITKIEQVCSFPVLINAAEIHFGLKKRFVTGFEWIFNNVEEEIIVLEDDTIPSISFFQYCSTALEHYKSDRQVAVICGSYRLHDDHRLHEKITEPFFNNIFCAWGWATWKSKFVPLYNPNLKRFNKLIKINSIYHMKNYDLFKKRYTVLKKIIDGKLDTWDVQLQWNIILNKKKVLTPHINLIFNNGLDELAATQKQNYNNLLFKPAKEWEVEAGIFNKKLKLRPEYDITIFDAIDNSTSVLNLVKYFAKKPIKSLLSIKENFKKLAIRIFYFLVSFITSHLQKPLINLVVVGEQKCGTSSLFDLLKNHPKIAAGKIKEKHVFDNSLLFKGSNKRKLHTQIARQFYFKEIKRLFSTEYFIDCTPDYVFRSESIQRLAHYNPSAKIIYIVRNPIDRFISSYYFYFHTAKYKSPFFEFDPEGREMKAFYEKNPNTSFKEYFQLETGANPIFKALKRGLYAKNIDYIYKYFTPESVIILSFENLINPNTSLLELKKLYEFLNIEDLQIGFPHAHRSKKSELIDAEQEFTWLKRYYAADQEKLYSMSI